MSIRTSGNELDGVTYWVSHDEKLSRLPPAIRKIVDRFDRDVFRDPETYIAKLAESCTYPAMRRWLLALAKGGFLELEIHTADVGPDDSIPLREVYFSYCVGDSSGFVSLRFRKKTPVGLIHSSLTPIFELVECINPGVWGCSGGQLGYEPGPDGLFTNMGWTKPSNEIDADLCQQLYTSADGNVIGCHEDGTTIWCDHGTMSRLGPIEDFLDLYFDSLVEDVDVYDSHDMVARLKGRSAGSR
jgi:hypothetical protein